MIVIRFDGPPSHESGRFIEVEKDGASISFGEWRQDGDDWLLVLTDVAKMEQALRELGSLVKEVWDSVPSVYEPVDHPEIVRHAKALNALNAISEETKQILENLSEQQQQGT